MKILITGSGTLARELLRQLQHAERLVIFSRNESKQAEMARQWPDDNKGGIRYVLGDIRDPERLLSGLNGIDTVIHTAALKRIEHCEYNPWECVKTNIQGTINVARACILAGVKKAIFISTDKAVSAVNIYGASKKVAEKAWIGSNNMGTTRFSVCRYGNVLGSNGSVVELWRELAKAGKEISITDTRMTRFFISIENAAKFIINKINLMEGGEIFVPVMCAKSMMELAGEIAPECKIVETGIRPGEKIHEKLIDETESRRCYKTGNEFFTIYPEQHAWRLEFPSKGEKVGEGFSYESK